MFYIIGVILGIVGLLWVLQGALTPAGIVLFVIGLVAAGAVPRRRL